MPASQETVPASDLGVRSLAAVTCRTPLIVQRGTSGVMRLALVPRPHMSQ